MSREHAPWYMVVLPTVVILAPAALSLLAWWGPVAPNGLSGYYARAAVSPWGVALVIAWYGSLIVVAQTGFSLGRRQGGFISLRAVSIEEVHRWTCVVGLVGTAWAYWVATDGSPSRILDVWRTQQFNTLRAGFEYGVGVPTLRYATILAGALTLVHLAGRGRPRAIDVLSLLGLVGTAFLASRLALVAAIFVAITIVLARGTFRRIRPGALLVGVVLILALFTALNYSRSAGTYRDAGVTNPVAMAALNAQAYLAAPTQVTLGFSSLVMDGDLDPARGGLESLSTALPSYAQSLEGSPAPTTSISRIVEVSPTLSTNGALPGLLYDGEWASLLVALGMAGLASWGAARFLLSGGVGAAFAGVLLYGLTELWRIFLFNQGILHFLILIGVAAVLIGRAREYRMLPALHRHGP